MDDLLAQARRLFRQIMTLRAGRPARNPEPAAEKTRSELQAQAKDVPFTHVKSGQ